MSGYIPQHFPVHIQALDAHIAQLMAERLRLANVYFYVPNIFNQECIAQTFDVSIKNFTPKEVSKMLQAPMTLKRTLGTKKAILDALDALELGAVIQTITTDKKLKPFEFSIKIEPKSDEVFDGKVLAKAKALIADTKPVRSAMAGIDAGTTQNLSVVMISNMQWRI